jgi:hypothetical protein
LFVVKRDQFPQLIAVGVMVGALDRGQFVRQQQLAGVAFQKFAEPGLVFDRTDAQQIRDGRELHQPLGGAELRHERMPVAKQLGGLASQNCFAAEHRVLISAVWPQSEPAFARETNAGFSTLPTAIAPAAKIFFG